MSTVLPFRAKGSGVLCFWRITDQVCLGQNVFFWNPRVLRSKFKAELSGLALVAKFRVW